MSNLELSISFDTDALREQMGSVSKQIDTALRTSANMIASMIREQSEADIAAAGRFDKGKLSVTVDEDNTVTTKFDGPGASLFETGGVIQGNPLLWLPISGTDAVGTQAKDYSGGLFSIKRPSGVPLLLSVEDHKPRYFGIASVRVEKKFHFAEIQQSVMDGFEDIFEKQLEAAEAHGS